MSAHEPLKSAAAKTGHSVLHNLTTLAPPFKPAPEIRSQILGGVMVVGLCAGLLILMRFLLAD
jgi:hypothetical protein